MYEPQPDEYATDKQGITVFRTEEVERPAYGSITLRVDHNANQYQTIRLTKQDFLTLRDQVNQLDVRFLDAPPVTAKQVWQRKSDGRFVEVIRLEASGRHVTWRYPDVEGRKSGLKLSTFLKNYELVKPDYVATLTQQQA